MSYAIDPMAAMSSGRISASRNNSISANDESSPAPYVRSSLRSHSTPNSTLNQNTRLKNSNAASDAHRRDASPASRYRAANSGWASELQWPTTSWMTSGSGV